MAVSFVTSHKHKYYNVNMYCNYTIIIFTLVLFATFEIYLVKLGTWCGTKEVDASKVIQPQRILIWETLLVSNK